MNETTHFKYCPRCQQPNRLFESECTKCGRVFKTKFIPPEEKTMVINMPNAYGAPSELHSAHQMEQHLSPPSDPSGYASVSPEVPIQQAPLPPPIPPEYYFGQNNSGVSAVMPDVVRRDLVQLPAGSHSPGIALLLSLLVIGIGQMYNRQVVKGVVLILICVVTAPLTLYVSWAVVAILSSVDAFCIGKKLRTGLPISQWEWF